LQTYVQDPGFELADFQMLFSSMTKISSLFWWFFGFFSSMHDSSVFSSLFLCKRTTLLASLSYMYLYQKLPSLLFLGYPCVDTSIHLYLWNILGRLDLTIFGYCLSMRKCHRLQTQAQRGQHLTHGRYSRQLATPHWSPVSNTTICSLICPIQVLYNRTTKSLSWESWHSVAHISVKPKTKRIGTTIAKGYTSLSKQKHIRT